jgi:hypothetical protein
MDSLIWRGFILLVVGVRASDVQWNPVRHRNQQGERNTVHQTGKNLGLNSGLPQAAEGRLITSQKPLVTVSLRFREQVEVLCCVRV